MTETVSLPNQALVCGGLNDLSIREWPLVLPAVRGRPVIPEGYVLIRVRATGICGSDIHFWKDGHAGPDIIKAPFVIGHECAGEIVELGAKVQDWEEGDRICIKPAKPCLRCFDCTSGQFNMCPNVFHFGVPGADGSCATMKLVPADQLVRLTPKISWAEAGVVQPLAISIQMSRQAGEFRHRNVMIFGGGCIGLLLGSIAKAYGAAKVVVLEKQANRAEFAKSFCADQTFVNPPREPSETTDAYSLRLSRHILQNTPGLNRGFDICIEASGDPECMSIGLRVCRPCGTYVQVGLYSGEHPQLPMMEICSKQLNVKGTWRYTTDCFEQAVSLIDRGQVDVERLVSHTYNFKDSLDAFEAVHKSADKSGNKCMKVVILHDGEDSKAGKVQASL